MALIAYYEADIHIFLRTNENTILGELVRQHGFALEHQQKSAWLEQISILKSQLNTDIKGTIYFEFFIPRMGKRADVVIFSCGRIFVIEFKIGAHKFECDAIDQVYDYALDLKNFHRGSHKLPIIPILISTKSELARCVGVEWGRDGVACPLKISKNRLLESIYYLDGVCEKFDGIYASEWANSGYQPTPTIVEAALSLYRHHDVKEITRTEAGADNLGLTALCVENQIEFAKNNCKKVVCFITGVPGAGKTLAGLNIATSRAGKYQDEHAVFLSGNGPLVDVLREALTRDKAERDGVSRNSASREVAAFIQNIHHFRDESLRSNQAPVEKVVVFDEAQRAWNREMASKFMQQKRGISDFSISEPEFLLSVMDRHLDWCVVICLIGGGQEINTGEAGLAEWLEVLKNRFSSWQVCISPRISDVDYFLDQRVVRELFDLNVHREDSLHLGVSIRSFRAETVSDFVSSILDGKSQQAEKFYATLEEKYPIVLTRDLSEAKLWVKKMARGNERYGLVASSGGARLRAEGVWIKQKIDAPVWFLNDKSDVRSSYYLEEVASEFDIQGLELDWTCVCWDADLKFSSGSWGFFSFRGTKWQNIKSKERQMYLKNAYRVLLTRARQGMVIFIPYGDASDPTRLPAMYDETYNYLVSCGIPVIN